MIIFQLIFVNYSLVAVLNHWSKEILPIQVNSKENKRNLFTPTVTNLRYENTHFVS